MFTSYRCPLVACCDGAETCSNVLRETVCVPEKVLCNLSSLLDDAQQVVRSHCRTRHAASAAPPALNPL